MQNTVYFNPEVWFHGATDMIRITVVAITLVMLAAIIDLGFGLTKAGIRKEFRSSWGLKRTALKVLLYTGVLLVLGFVDALIHMSRMYTIFGWNEMLGIPILVIGMGIFLLVVEVRSMFESADQKTKTEINRGAEMLKEMAEYRQSIEKITQILDIMQKAQQMKPVEQQS